MVLPVVVVLIACYGSHGSASTMELPAYSQPITSTTIILPYPVFAVYSSLQNV